MVNTYAYKTLLKNAIATFVRREEKSPKYSVGLNDSFIPTVIAGQTDSGVVTADFSAPILGCYGSGCSNRARRTTSTNGTATQSWKTPVSGTIAKTDIVTFYLAFDSASTATTVDLQVSKKGDEGVNYDLYTSLTGVKVANNVYQYTVDLSQAGVITGTGWDLTGATSFTISATNSTLAFVMDFYGLFLVDNFSDLVTKEEIFESCLEEVSIDSPDELEEDDCGGISYAGKDTPITVKVTGKRVSKNHLMLNPKARRVNNVSYLKPYVRDETFVSKTINGVIYAGVNLSGSNIGACDRIIVTLNECADGTSQLVFKNLSTGYFGQIIPVGYSTVINEEEDPLNAGWLIANSSYIGKVVEVETTTTQTTTAIDLNGDKSKVVYDIFIEGTWSDGQKQQLVVTDLLTEGGTWLKWANSANQTFEYSFKTDIGKAQILDVPLS